MSGCSVGPGTRLLLKGAYSLFTNPKSSKYCEKRSGVLRLRLAPRATRADCVAPLPQFFHQGAPPPDTPTPARSRFTKSTLQHTPSAGVPPLGIVFPTGPGSPTACRELLSRRSRCSSAAGLRRVAGSGSARPGPAPRRSPWC